MRKMSWLCIIVLAATFSAGIATGGQKNVTVSPKTYSLSDDCLLDKIYGSLYGKCIGLALAQPVEGLPRSEIEKKSRAADFYPVTYYFPAHFDARHHGEFLIDKLDGAPKNDDTTLMMASLLTLRDRGVDINARDIAESWLKYVRSGCTAEGIGLANLKKGIWPPESGMVDNPYRQWIGAQMKAEIWGMIAPEMPEVAAEYAKQDAMVTHVRNGIYGAQYIAAAVSIAMTENDPRAVVQKALRVIPGNSEYAHCIKDVLACYDDGKTWRQAWQVLDDRYAYNDDGTRAGKFVEEKYNTGEGLYKWGNWRWVHVVPNGGACAIGILYGKGDFSKSVCIATMCGYDADCNAGSVGGVIGAMIGESNIPEKWKKPIHDDFAPALEGLPKTVKLSELAKEIAGYAKQVRALQKRNVISQDSTPPIRAITTGPNFHWFGYYDKYQFDPTDRYVLGMKVDFENRLPTEKDAVKIGMIDLANDNKWIELGESRAWSWQQGCMLQWRPGSDREVVWNDREGGRFVCRVLDVKTRKVRTLPRAIGSISPDGKLALCEDFSRIWNFRAGYAYAGIDDPYAKEPAPAEIGVWRMDMDTGKTRLLVSVADLAKIPYPGQMPDHRHYINHLSWNPDGTRFLMFNRWAGKGQPTRVFTMAADGSDLRLLSSRGASHWTWRDPEHVLIWAKGYKLYKDDGSGKPKSLLWSHQNGHQSYVPGTKNEWLLTDTYPKGKNREQVVYLYHIPTGRKVELGRFHSPRDYKGDWRCDTHPRLSRDGTKVVIDSPHGGNGRQMYMIDISGIIKTETKTQ